MTDVLCVSVGPLCCRPPGSATAGRRPCCCSSMLRYFLHLDGTLLWTPPAEAPCFHFKPLVACFSCQENGIRFSKARTVNPEAKVAFYISQSYSRTSDQIWVCVKEDPPSGKGGWAWPRWEWPRHPYFNVHMLAARLKQSPRWFWNSAHTHLWVSQRGRTVTLVTVQLQTFFFFFISAVYSCLLY